MTSVAVIAAWWLVARNSGNGWVQTLGDIVFGALVVGVVGPALAVWRVRVEVVQAPADARAGLPIVVAVRASGRVRIRPVDPVGPGYMAGPGGTGRKHTAGPGGAGRQHTARPGGGRRRLPEPDEIVLMPARRGVYQSIVVEVASAAPFGLQWWSRRIDLPLRDALHIAPRRGEPERQIPTERTAVGSNGRSHLDSTGDLRSARPYRAGDRRSHVHWPITAHSGELMVREVEAPRGRPMTVTVRLPADPDEAERIAERALATILHLLERGTSTVVSTDETDGPVVGAVDDGRQAGRRLARAVPFGAPAGPGDAARGGVQVDEAG